ncbi:Aldehyde oxidase glox1 [Thalictrum thalictroides]|uniref:Aldehyde oxidase glox1 n=1 Tax=Thalictrum thalictroides TaxID=46969 RepID=A0A7J6UXF8_THATH|nr:Aldehyde oxidase glox1 [Thalictrum thalictroides]
MFTGGEWRILQRSIGISAMHMQLLHNNQVVMFDRTDFGPSNLSLPFGRCRIDSNDIALKHDCTAHSILYDIGTNIYRPLMVQTDTFCSSGAVLPDGTFIQIGGYNDGDRTIRTLSPCITNDCDWIEHHGYLNERRWYATNQRLPDGRIIIVGGRRQFNYEFYPKGSGDDNTYELNFLRETNDRQENNLYPFLHLLPDGNLFIFANTRAILFDYRRNQIVREFPRIPGGDPRNYPSSGSSVLLPIQFSVNPGRFIEAEVLICGGAPQGSAARALRGNFVLATPMCGRLRVTDSNPAWEMEQMPNRRVMGDMLILPTGDIIIINGARSGTAGWELGRHPVTIPVVYRPNEPSNQRFLLMRAGSTARMYHSSAIVIPDGRILIAGSNPHINYSFTNVRYPTELSLESFSPPYLAPEYDNLRPRITACPEIINYRQTMSITFSVPEYRSARQVSVRILAPSFTTHSLAMNQRMVILRVVEVRQVVMWTYEITAVGPPLAEVAPSGYYLMFLVHDGTPSSGTWVKLQ